MLRFRAENQHQQFFEANMRENDENSSFTQSQIIMRNEIEFEGEKEIFLLLLAASPPPPSSHSREAMWDFISIYTAPLCLITTMF